MSICSSERKDIRRTTTIFICKPNLLKIRSNISN